MNIAKEVWILTEQPEALAELCNGALVLGEKVTALVIGTKSHSEQAIAFGANQVYWLGDTDETRMMEDYTDTLFNLLADKKPELFLVDSTKRCKHIAGRLAARLRTSVLTDVVEFITSGENLEAKRMVYGGAAVRTERSLSTIVIASVGSGVFEAAKEDKSRQGIIEDVVFVEPSIKTRCLEKRTKAVKSVKLSAAKRVVAVGRGIANEEDLKIIEEFAHLLGAEIGCTRPLSEGVAWIPRERYIGVSGVMFKPDLYIGIGISGQVQHMVGVNQAPTIISINTDSAAPIFKQSDYGIVGDLYKVIPALIKAIKANKGSE